MSAKSMEEIAQLLKDVKFRHTLLGGVKEDDVWRVLEKMQREYSAVLEAQRNWYEALLRQRDDQLAHMTQATRGGEAEGDIHG